MENRRRLRISASDSTAAIGDKLTSLVTQKEQVKIAYHQLKSQIKLGLAEVFVTTNRDFSCFSSILFRVFEKLKRGIVVDYLYFFLLFPGGSGVQFLGRSVDEAGWFENRGNG